MRPLVHSGAGVGEERVSLPRHMVPLYKATPPNNVTGTPFDLFLMEKQAADGVAGAAADADKCADVAALFAKEMAGQETRRAELLEEEQEDR